MAAGVTRWVLLPSEEHGAHASGVVDSGERASKQFELDAGGWEGRGEGDEFGGVAGRPFHLVDGAERPSLSRHRALLPMPERRFASAFAGKAGVGSGVH
jgi:hypothetical protein